MSDHEAEWQADEHDRQASEEARKFALQIQQAEAEARREAMLPQLQAAARQSVVPEQAAPPAPTTNASGRTTSLPFATLGDVLRDAPEEPLWTLRGYVAPTVLTLFAGRWKVGKSTFIFGLLNALQQGGMFMGIKVQPAGVLLLTEERQLTLNEKAILFGLEGDGVHVLMRHQTFGFSWPEVVREARDYCLAHELGVLVVDTWDKFATGGDENSADDTIRAITPLMDAAGDGLAVVIVTHQRKGAGKHGEAVRGSSALVGAVDIILELERASGDLGEEGARVLIGTSRFSSTPEKVVLQFNEETGEYRSDDYDEARVRSERAAVHAALDDTPRTADEIQDRVQMNRQHLRQHLHAMADAGEISFVGTGKKNDPWRYSAGRPGDPRFRSGDTSREEDPDAEHGFRSENPAPRGGDPGTETGNRMVEPKKPFQGSGTETSEEPSLVSVPAVLERNRTARTETSDELAWCPKCEQWKAYVAVAGIRTGKCGHRIPPASEEVVEA